MPIIKSAKKRVKQAAVRTQRNKIQRRRLHDVKKDFYDLIKEGKADEAQKLYAQFQKVVDTCAKKNIIPKNRAARIKSAAAKAIASLNA